MEFCGFKQLKKKLKRPVSTDPAQNLNEHHKSVPYACYSQALLQFSCPRCSSPLISSLSLSFLSLFALSLIRICSTLYVPVSLGSVVPHYNQSTLPLSLAQTLQSFWVLRTDASQFRHALGHPVLAGHNSCGAPSIHMVSVGRSDNQPSRIQKALCTSGTVI